MQKAVISAVTSLQPSLWMFLCVSDTVWYWMFNSQFLAPTAVGGSFNTALMCRSEMPARFYCFIRWRENVITLQMPYWMKMNALFLLADTMLRGHFCILTLNMLKFYASLKLKTTKCFFFLCFFFFDVTLRIWFRFSVCLNCSSCDTWRYLNKDIQVCRPCVLLQVERQQSATQCYFKFLNCSIWCHSPGLVCSCLQTTTG